MSERSKKLFTNFGNWYWRWCHRHSAKRLCAYFEKHRSKYPEFDETKQFQTVDGYIKVFAVPNGSRITITRTG